MITMYIKAKYSNSQSFYLWLILNSCLTDYIESQVLIVTKNITHSMVIFWFNTSCPSSRSLALPLPMSETKIIRKHIKLENSNITGH